MLKKILFFIILTFTNFLFSQKTYQHLIMYGQSYSTGAQSYPVISTENEPGNYMIGNQVWIAYGNTDNTKFNLLKGVIAASSITINSNKHQSASELTSAEAPLLGLTNHLQKKMTKDGKSINYLASADGQGGTSIEELSKITPANNINFYKDYFIKSLESASAIAKKEGSKISSPAIFWLQGEYNYRETSGYPPQKSTSDKNAYLNYLIALKNNMQNDIVKQYGQEKKPVFITYQTASFETNDKVTIGNAQVEASNTYPDIICAGPTYQMPHRENHLDPNGYRWYGEMLGKVYYQTQIEGKDFKPLQPKRIYRIDSKSIGIEFLVPKGPLVFDTNIIPAVKNYGFKVKLNGVEQTVSSIKIENNNVVISCASVLNGDVDINYGNAIIPSYKVGNLRDSDDYPSFYKYLDLDEKNPDDTYVYPRYSGVLRPLYEPKDGNNNPLYNKLYPLYNFSVAFEYGLGPNQNEVMMPGFFSQDIIYVKKGGNGNGNSWSNSMGELADAVKLANQQNIGEIQNIKQIWVAKGTYLPKYRADNFKGANPLDRSNSFVLPKNVEIYGGFSGIETGVTQRDWKNNATILSGDLKGDDGANFTNTTDNTYHVTVSSGDAGITLLDGFTITAGNGNTAGNIIINGRTVYADYGGGMYLSNSSPKIKNLIFKNNQAYTGGGGMANYASSPTLTNLIVSNNTAGNGGGIYNLDASPSLSNITISENTVPRYGGGIYNINSNSTLTNISIENNKAADGGGMYNINGSSVLTNIKIAGNQASGFGGGIFNKSSTANMTNLVIVENKAATGGGLFIEASSSSKLTNITISKNQATVAGSGVYNHSMSPTKVYNSIIWGNEPKEKNIGNYSSTADYNYSLVQGVTTNDEKGNFSGDTDPIFENMDNGDYHLNINSLVIDKGNNSYISSFATDLDENPRISNGTIDFGAYENQCSYLWNDVILNEKTTVHVNNLPQGIEITNLPEGATVIYTYEGINTTVYPEENKNIPPTNAGEYKVTAIATHPEGCAKTFITSLLINKADFTGISLEDKSVDYNKLPHNLEIAGIPFEPTIVVYEYEGIDPTVYVKTQTPPTSAGSYKVTATLTNPNYNDLELPAILTINRIDFSGISLVNKTVTYDTTAHDLKVTGDLPLETTEVYEYEGIDSTVYVKTQTPPTDAGSYKVTTTLTNLNYNDLGLQAVLTINKADFNTAVIIFKDNSFTYNTTAHNLFVEGTIPAGTEVTYTNNNQINAAKYTVTAKLTNPNYNNLAPLTATLTINKAQTAITAESTQAFIYNGAIQNITASLNHTESTLVFSPQQGYTEVGTYDINISANESANYLTPIVKKVVLTINKADFDTALITFKDNTFTYDTTAHNLMVGGTIPSGTDIVYSNNNQTNAGQYTVTAKLTNSNYKDLPLSATLTITKADFNTALISFEDNTFTYDTTVHSLIVGGTIPAETEITYSNNNQINAGQYTVTAKLTNPNYIDLELPATLTIIKADFNTALITFENNTFTYDTTVHSLIVGGTIPAETEITYSNNNQINAGKYTVTAKLTNPNYMDLPISATLTINKAQAAITTVGSQTFTYDGTTKNVAASLNHTESTLIFSPQQGYTGVGNYDINISANESANYLAPISQKVVLTINKANFDTTLITFKDGVFTYDTTVHSLIVGGTIPAGTTITYSNNNQINAGKHTVTAKLTNPNYNDLTPHLSATLAINKALATITTESTQSFTYDGTIKNIAASLNHTESVLTFSPQRGYTEVGNYDINVSANESANYLAPISQKVKLVINRFAFTGITLDNKTVTYNGLPQSLSVSGTIPSGTTVTYSNNNQINAGKYTVTAKLTNPNYIDLELPATLTIIKADFNTALITFENNTFTYDTTVHSLIVGGTIPAGTTVTYSNNNQINAGSYTVTAKLTNANYNEKDLSATLTINKANFNTALITFKEESFTYDATAHSLAVGGIIPEGTTVTYSNNNQINAGKYTVTAKLTNPNYNDLVSPLSATLIINKANFNTALMIFKDNTFTYNQASHSLIVGGTIPAGTTITYSNNNQINAGKYTVTAKLTNPNYNDLTPHLSATLAINKALAAITAESTQSFTYDGTIKNIAASLNHTESVLTFSPQRGYTEVGNYDINVSANESANYLAPISQKVKLVINRFAFTGITLDNKTVTYNGLPQSLSVSGILPAGTTVTYNNNNQINAGKYAITAKLTNPNYTDLVLSATLIINKTDFNTALITFKDEAFTYDTAIHNLVVGGTIPTGTTVTYTNNNQVNAGKYTVTAKLSNPNYNEKHLSATLTIDKANFNTALITFKDGAFTYDATAHSLAVGGTIPVGTTVTYSNNNQVNAGKYTVTAKLSNPNYNDWISPLSATLIINKANFDTVNLLINKTVDYNGSPQSLVVSGNIPTGTSITYSNNTHTNAGVYTVTAKLTNPNYNNLVTPLTATFIINKIQTIITAESTQTFSYDGTVKNIAASLNHTETALSFSPQQGYTNAGNYTITIVAPETLNYSTATKEVSLIIESTLGVDDPNTIIVKEIKVAPNPVSTILKVILPKPATDKDLIRVYSLVGQLITQEWVMPGESIKEIDFRNLYSGTYILKYKNKSVKIIKE